MQNKERVIVENVQPQVNKGAFYIKRVPGEKVTVTADIFSDGHDIVSASVKYKVQKDKKWREIRMAPTVNDAWKANFIVEKEGLYAYVVEGWVDHALNWHHGIVLKISDGQQVQSELLEGAEYLVAIKKLSPKKEHVYIDNCIAVFGDSSKYQQAITEVSSEKFHGLLLDYPVKTTITSSASFGVNVERLKARFSTWYEFFPRSTSEEKNKHGTFKDCERLLPKVAEMGFDVLYFPPVHPIGEINRKGKNNATNAQKNDVGSPWGIGSKHGGHKAIHPDLGNLDDFKQLVKKAKDFKIEIAMDFALQCAPDHPYVKEHPKWFKWRPDGTVQYAENPPKKYQDILPIYFETDDWKNLWEELLSIALYWVEECEIGIFRVDNPHTKPFNFWGWLIAEVKKKHPEVLFLAEAFTKPKVMQELGKQGFSQSYTYFTWRNTKEELTSYVNELTKTEQKEYYRPNFWPNTPDINPYALQTANEAMYLQKYFLAATLSSNTGIYGPVFEQMVCDAVPGKEEYNSSEKYQIQNWDWNLENKLTRIIAKINQIRKQNTSLQQTNNIDFCDTDNDMLMAYYKYDDQKSNETFMVVNMDANQMKQGWVKMPLHQLGVQEGHQLRMEDLITGSSYIWDKEWNYIELHPALPFHLFKIHK
ncbi:alpha-1,4-glucan--maltose-1-phosphate maltosyltransferase [Galbibacter pacificus]|uniref:Alpha-1,4-glucan:maltose-1-phosphate maltosyltransferase n=1 Tax=Galbibacter pacificus TaxID=2996052 RepID=A0ABT6FPM1_9FLAO|nr:alpha-1,4-glucan--maltose-1-phosphate maltosyltransferase [Galbibacter pacificus]MDG3582349.1 alpha-1,4-glucan--maltose-1-phosphate maltosyltransferase [Galbibacter pacificus]MDG3585175.1 alpha-1,4-glucan--maltose-1-phosphate maltosyltransferase [Galbibacter pacificus]